MSFRRGFAFPGLSYGNFFLDMFSIFLFIVWFWLLITVARDLFRRRDVSGLAKALWVIGWLVFPYIAVLLYPQGRLRAAPLAANGAAPALRRFQGRGMAERNVQQGQQALEDLRRTVGFSAADEIEKLDRLKKAGSISDAEFSLLRARLVQ